MTDKKLLKKHIKIVFLKVRLHLDIYFLQLINFFNYCIQNVIFKNFCFYLFYNLYVLRSISDLNF